ncbi:low molecular weight phosphatase family protein [candidate division WOR-3 bacterium 4484_100]|uniref:Low molecular weight phosphatase family protein n=1 Tax=candidate division WOR-3 bacterium 4484_100 TaxID=1936077 RepID=A0A1V4QI49_UNCW3|nr:MAG: low molecular weight phosphatase family protein [candidate division WOR-3 bacterium 4484_100]
MKKKRVLFICTHNAVRSQIAEGFLRSLYGDRYEVFSAGTEPMRINPYAIRVMEELGIDISEQRAKPLVRFLGDRFDLVVTVCNRARECCPFFAGAKRVEHKGFDDPDRFVGNEEQILAKFRNLRDQIKNWIEERFRTVVEKPQC